MPQKLIVTKQMIESKATQLTHLTKQAQQVNIELQELLQNYQPNVTEEVQGMEQPPHSYCVRKCLTCQKTLNVGE